MPLALVVPEVAFSVPQAPFTLGLVVMFTRSPATTAPVESVTVTVTVDVLLPSAGMDDGLADTLTVNGAGVGLWTWVMTVEPLPPVPDSVAVMVQKPTVVDDR